MYDMNFSRNIWLPWQQNLVFLLKMEFPPILVARQRTTHVLHLLSNSLLQNIAKTLFNTIGEIKSPLLYCYRFEMILHSWHLVRSVVSANAHR